MLEITMRGGAFNTEWITNSCEDISRDIKLPKKKAAKKGGEFHTEFNSYSCKDIRGTTTGSSFLQKSFVIPA